MPFAQLRALVISLIDLPPDRPIGDAGEGAPVPSARCTPIDPVAGPRRAGRLPTDPGDDPVAEFDTRPTTCLPGPRTSTLDQLISALQRFPDRPRRR